MSGRELKATLKQLESLAAKAGAPVRYEPLRAASTKDPSRSVARGGLVRLGPLRFVLCDAGLPPIDKIAVIAEALAALGVDSLLVPPLLRARIRKKPARPPKPRVSWKPVAKARGTA